MSSIETELTPEQLAANVFAMISGESSTADTVEAPADEVAPADVADTGESRPEVTEDANGRLRGADGKFVAREGEDVPDEELDAEETLEDEKESEADPFVIEVDDEETAQKVEALLEKYGGDVVKALIGATEAQSLIGRKGSETAQKDAELAAVRQELQRLTQVVTDSASRPPMVPITQDLIEQNPSQAAAQAVLQDNVVAFRAAITAWQEGTSYVEANPEAASLFLEKVALEARVAELSQKPTEIPVETNVELDAEIAKVVERHPDLENFLPQIAEAANERLLLRNVMENGSPAEQAQALEDLYIVVKSRLAADTSVDTMRKIQVRVKQEADAARAGARVVTANRGSAATDGPSSGKDQFLDAFEARMGIDTHEE